jgi:hypothetical protein
MPKYRLLMAVGDPEFRKNRPDLADPSIWGGKETGPI